MKAARLAAAALLVACLLPEWGRYLAERHLYRVSSATLLAARAPERVPGGARTLLAFADEGRSAARALPGDARPLIAAASLERLAGRPEASRELLLTALAAGERPDVLLGLWQTARALGRPDEGRQALLRAAWLAPFIVEALDHDDARAAVATVRGLEAGFESGSRPEPPPAFVR